MHCKWSSWGGWSKCSAKCGTGSQVRKRTVAKTAKNGGKKCAGSRNERRSCKGGNCRQLYGGT